MEKDIEYFICSLVNEEGIGSTYERIVLKNFFKKITLQYAFENVLEYGCKITKGFDNLIYMENKAVTISDKEIENIKSKWSLPNKPKFSDLEGLTQKYDLVWNFALIQQNPEMLIKMKDLSKKFVLIFTPNIYNCGTPFHWGYHLITRRPCHHAEQGSKSLRTLNGLKKFILKNGLKVVDCGYIDMPPIPDIGFSRYELYDFLGFKNKKRENTKIIPQDILDQINKMMLFEKKDLSNCIKSIMAHHNYILAEI